MVREFVESDAARGVALSLFLIINAYRCGGFMPDGRVCFIRPTLADQWQVCVSPDLEPDSGISDVYSYWNLTDARKAWVQWDLRNYAGEPEGWIRHQPSDRRRLNGDPTTEEIRA